MPNKNIAHLFSSILWSVFLIGIMEIMYYFIIINDLANYFILSFLLGTTIVITAVKTFHPRVGYYHELLPYLIHPVFLFIGFVSFLIFNENIYLRQMAIVLTLIGYTVLFSENYSDLAHKAHDGVKFLIILFLFNTVFETVHTMGLPIYIIPLFIILISLLLFYHMFWRLDALGDRFIGLGFIFSIFIGATAYLLVNYYIFASFLILSIILLTIYYVFWGILHHYIEKNLTFYIFVEYLLIAGIIISMFLGLITGW